MNVGTAWSVINRDPETSAPLPEAVWYQELTTDDEGAKSPGFFVSLLQRWDIASDAADSKSVFYQVSPFPATTNNVSERIEGSELVGECRQFRLRLPRQLAVFDEITDDHDDDSPNFGSPSSGAPRSPRMQKRRVPLLARFTDNQKVLFMQFSNSYVRVAVPDADGYNQNSSCKHWTVELQSCVKDPYVPVSSLPEALPKIRIPSSLRSKTSASETILPGGIFWLNQSYGNARGSDYQEFLLGMITTKSLLCYTVTLNRLNKTKPTLTMTLSHIFAHPQASAAWWAPKSLVLVVGSYQDVQVSKQQYQDHHSNQHKGQQLFLRTYFFGGNGPFTSQREVLRNPLLLPLRLERPPPVRFEAFPVGKPASFSLPSIPTNIEQNQGSTDSSQTSSPSSRPELHREQRTPPIHCISVVQLYGKSFIVEIGAGTILSRSGEHCLDITLHGLDRENFSVNIGKIRLQLIIPKKIRSSKEDILVTTLDDLLCVTCRRSKLHLFLDIHDIELGCSDVVEKFATDKEREYLEPDTPVLFIPPGHLFSPQKGVMLPLALDLERLAPSVSKHHRCNFSMLLRRKQSQSIAGRHIAISRFASIGALPSADLRLKWIDHAASVYARCPFINCASPHVRQEDKRKVSPLQWDLHSTLHLMFQCALLPEGAEFLPFCDLNEARLDKLSSLPRLSSNDVLFQTDLLTCIFLPRTWKMLKETRRAENCTDRVLVVRRVAELALFYRGALEHHGSTPCPALECFVFAILWRLGDAQGLFALLKSRTWASGSLLEVKHLKSQRTLVYLSTKWQASLLMAIVNGVEFGSLCCVSKGQTKHNQEAPALRNRTLQVSLAMLSTGGGDFRLPADLIAQLLLQRRLQWAMTAASSLLEATDEITQAGSKRNWPNAALIQAKRLNHGEDFLEVARALLTQSMKSNSTGVCRILQSLYSFLLKWDPDCLRQDFQDLSCITIDRRLTKDDIDYGQVPFCSANKKRIRRRPSWIAMSAVEKSKCSSRLERDRPGLPAGSAETGHCDKGAKPLPFGLGVTVGSEADITFPSYLQELVATINYRSF